MFSHASTGKSKPGKENITLLSVWCHFREFRNRSNVKKGREIHTAGFKSGNQSLNWSQHPATVLLGKPKGSGEGSLGRRFFLCSLSISFTCPHSGMVYGFGGGNGPLLSGCFLMSNYLFLNSLLRETSRVFVTGDKWETCMEYGSNKHKEGCLWMGRGGACGVTLFVCWYCSPDNNMPFIEYILV